MDQPKIRKLLKEVANLHKQEFTDSNGNDPNWAEWYANHLLSHELIPYNVRKIEPGALVRLLEMLDHQFKSESQSMPWEKYYAEKLQKIFNFPH